MIPGSLDKPFESEIYSTKAADPPELQIVFDRSDECFAISLIRLAAFFLTTWS
jgi:hypothetical protein